MATKLHMKVHEYQTEGGHLLVSFCTDESKNSVEDYPLYSFQPHDFSVDTIDQLLPLIAQRGLDIAQRQDAKETLQENSGIMIDLQDLVGTVKEFAIDDISPKEVPVGSLTDIVVK